MSSNLDRLRLVARRLGTLRSDFVLVGATVLELLLADHGGKPVRITQDVDFIVRVQSRGDFDELGERLRRLGFQHRRPGHIDSWEIDGCEVDIVDCGGSHGSLNRWYEEAMERAVWRDIGDGLEIRVITGPYFVATKLEAFRGRGRGRFDDSEDLEDILTLLDRMPTVVEEIGRQNASLRRFIAERIRELLSEQEFLNTLAGHVDPGRGPAVKQLLEALAALA